MNLITEENKHKRRKLRKQTNKQTNMKTKQTLAESVDYQVPAAEYHHEQPVHIIRYASGINKSATRSVSGKSIK